MRFLDNRFSVPARARSRGLVFACERGFTLIELLITMSMALIILTATFSLLGTSQKDDNALMSRADAVQSANSGLREMTQDLRQAYAIEYPLSTTTALSTTPNCHAVSGTQPCDVIDILARLSGTGFSYSDYEIRYDCTVASTTVTGDTSCWRYLCSASATTAVPGSSCTASSSTLLSSRETIDDVSNGTSPVFSLCYTSNSTSGGACTATGTANSGVVTIDTPAAGALSSAAGGDPATITLTNGIYMPNLTYGQ
jgi:prepilin-type N-terminal cleavage/methylation domain-containing protein